MPRDSSRGCSVVGGRVVRAGVGVDTGVVVTGPLDPLFAQVRETLECPNQDAPMHTRTGCTYCSATADAFAALSAIERHVQDMEKALRDVARVSDDALQDGHPGIPDVARLHRIAVAALDDVLAAALPAREKGTE